MTTDIIDRLEAVEIEKTQHVMLATMARIFHGLLQTPLKLATVHETSQSVMAGLVGHLPRNAARFGHIMQQHHTTLRLRAVTTQWCHSQFHHAL